MAIVRRRLDPAHKPKLSANTAARLKAMTPQDIERNAREDSDNPPLTEVELERAVMARRIRRMREATGLSQAKFAARFRINHARLRDWERGRFMPDSVAKAYLTVIESNPAAVERALAKAERDSAG